jgi:hypothetical protein
LLAFRPRARALRAFRSGSGAQKIASEADLGKDGKGRWFGLLALLVLVTGGEAGEGLWSLGLRTQGIVDFEPGQDFVEGPEIGYSDFNWFGHKLQLKAAWLTSRAEWLFRPNIYRQDYFLFSPVWHFRRSAFFDPTFQVDLGYWRYDTEGFDGLENDSWLGSAQLGLALNLFQGKYGLFGHFGYNFIVPESGLVYPALFGFGFWKML